MLFGFFTSPGFRKLPANTDGALLCYRGVGMFKSKLRSETIERGRSGG